MEDVGITDEDIMKQFTSIYYGVYEFIKYTPVLDGSCQDSFTDPEGGITDELIIKRLRYSLNFFMNLGTLENVELMLI